MWLECHSNSRIVFMSTPDSIRVTPIPAIDRPARNTTRQREAGAAARAETRRLLVLAAAELFTERGYAGSTVSAIAERAGVSLQTLYSAWGSKRLLLRAYMEYALSGSPTALTEQSWVGQVRDQVAGHLAGTTDPRAQLRVAARVFRNVAERAAIGWKLYRDAAAADADIAADQAEISGGRRHTMAALLTAAHLDTASLRPGLTFQNALDTVMALLSPESYDVLVRQLAYTLDEYEEWMANTLIAALLPDKPENPN